MDSSSASEDKIDPDGTVLSVAKSAGAESQRKSSSSSSSSSGRSSSSSSRDTVAQELSGAVVSAVVETEVDESSESQQPVQSVSSSSSSSSSQDLLRRRAPEDVALAPLDVSENKDSRETSSSSSSRDDVLAPDVSAPDVKPDAKPPPTRQDLKAFLLARQRQQAQFFQQKPAPEIDRFIATDDAAPGSRPTSLPKKGKSKPLYASKGKGKPPKKPASKAPATASEPSINALAGDIAKSAVGTSS